eukprot:TRINITY_DN14487_c0_g2_i1.p1 TRINITY_DN14487_c0_g2~~TRINITY_DN14487_c0_g2_i1.p1  ORF type:complete len:767 (+),score=70.73 TRINITY_DN14487_c0_g2_i1:81-2303(+)
MEMPCRSCSSRRLVSAIVSIGVIVLSVLALLSRRSRDVGEDVSNLRPLQESNPNFYTRSDVLEFASKSHHLYYQAGQLPRVLVYSFVDISRKIKPSVAGNAPSAASLVYRNYCYTHAHGFDLEFASPRHSQGTDIRDHREDRPPPDKDDNGFFLMLSDVQTYMATGKYDYIFVMLGNTFINNLFFDFPVWAYDRGHDITVQDQSKSNAGFQLRSILFRVSSGARRFIQNTLLYQDPNQLLIQNGQGAFLETLLRSLGQEADENGREGYRNACSDLVRLRYLTTRDAILAEQVASYNECFFSELERIAGPHGYRDSKLVGFMKTYLWREDKVLSFSDVRGEGLLLPRPSCLNVSRWQDDCFAVHLSVPDGEALNQAIAPTCPDTSFAWTNFYAGNDLLWFRNWALQSKHTRRPPRVLIYTWCTENSFKLFLNEAHWKHCYAHAHGYDILFSEHLNVSGVKKYTKTVSDFSTAWYSDDMMWAWNRDVKRYLFSGKYDYVFNVGADVLFLRNYLDFPVWAYDTGHDITIMDQDYVSYGFNQNAVLFKPTEFTRDYLDLHYGYRRDFWLQGDNGPWMEVMLVYLGQEAEAAGRPGYTNSCAELGILTKPSALIVQENLTKAIIINTKYSRCFFQELDRMVGTINSRNSLHIGWSKSAIVTNNEERLPRDNDLLSSKNVMPWANCFSWVRQTWTDFEHNCFAHHWNGVKTDTRDSVVDGKCPDPTFDWKNSPWNFANRAQHPKRA